MTVIEKSQDELIFKCVSIEDTKHTAEFFAQFAKSGQCFGLRGGLGYGKTTFFQYFIKSLNPLIQDITSPTFTIVQTYASPISEIWHVDCYRLKYREEFFELGLEEACDHCITIIEWPEIIQDLLPKNTINIDFSIDSKNSDMRIIKCNNKNILQYSEYPNKFTL